MQLGVEGPPQDFMACTIIDDPKLFGRTAFYSEGCVKHQKEAPLHTRELSVSAKEGVTFSTFFSECSKMSEDVAEEGKDIGKWGIAVTRGVQYMRVKIMDGD